MRFRFPLHLDPNPAPGAPAPAPAPAAPAPAPAPAPTAARVNAYLDRLLARHGSLEQAVVALSTQLIGLEDQQETITRTMNELRARTPEGSVVLQPGAEVTLWKAVTELKLDEKAVRALHTENTQLKTEKATFDRTKSDHEAASAAGFNAQVFADLVRDRVVEMRDTPVKNAQGVDTLKKLPWVRAANDEKAAFEPFLTYVEREKRAYLPALTSTAPAPAATAPAQPGPTWPGAQPPDPRTLGQPGAGGADPVSAFSKKVNDARAARPNPAVPTPRVAAPAPS